MTKINRRLVLGAVLCAALAVTIVVRLAVAEDKFIIVRSTTSTQNSGLFEHILPLFTKKTGIEVRVVAVGTGQALKNAENGDGDVVLVHSKPDEEKFVADSWGVKRYDVMYNDFIIVGPTADPAKIAGVKDPVQAFKQIAEAKAPFASRADDSGTNKAELKLWQGAGIDAKASSGSPSSSPRDAGYPCHEFAVGLHVQTTAKECQWSWRIASSCDLPADSQASLLSKLAVAVEEPE